MQVLDIQTNQQYVKKISKRKEKKKKNTCSQIQEFGSEVSKRRLCREKQMS